MAAVHAADHPQAPRGAAQSSAGSRLILCSQITLDLAFTLECVRASSSASIQQARGNAAAPTGGHACPHDDGGMKLPAGFCATVFADGIGRR
jgi:hypothetical protein